MRKRTIGLAMLLAATVGPASTAQFHKPMPQHGPPAAAVGGHTVIEGPLKSSATGSTFVVAARHHDSFTVDASQARVRYRGKPMNPGALKKGAFVIVSGVLLGRQVKANDVLVRQLSGATLVEPKRRPRARAGAAAGAHGRGAGASGQARSSSSTHGAH